MKRKILLGLILITIGILVFGIISVSAATEGIYTYSVSNGEATITSCDNSVSGDIVIPDALGGYPVTSIGNYAFYECDSLTSITIPDSVTRIDDFAFYKCINLTDIYYKGTEENWEKISIRSDNDALTNAIIHFKQKWCGEYPINGIVIKDMSGNSLQAIPTGMFRAVISFTNVNSSEDTIIMLAQYTYTGILKELICIQKEDVPIGSTIKLSIPVDNSKGDVAKLKAFFWDSFISLTPSGNSSSIVRSYKKINKKMIDRLNSVIDSFAKIEFTDDEKSIITLIEDVVKSALDESDKVELTYEYLREKYKGAVIKVDTMMNDLGEDAKEDFLVKILRKVDDDAYDFLLEVFFPIEE